MAVIASKPLWYGESAINKVTVPNENYTDNSRINGSNTDGKETNTSTPNPQSTGNGLNEVNESYSLDTGLSEMMDAALGQNKPAVLVFTYNADCCPSTKEFFDMHRTTVKRLEEKYADGANFVWIDVDLYGQVDKGTLMNIAKDYGVTAIPAVVLIDAKGMPLPVLLGELDGQAAKN